MNPKEKYAATLKSVQAIVDAAEVRDLTDAEAAELETQLSELTELKAKLERAAKSAALLAQIAGTVDSEEATGHGAPDGPVLTAKSRLALSGPAVKAAGRRIAPKIEDSYRKTFLAPGTSELFALPVVDGIAELPTVPTSILELLPLTPRSTPTWNYLEQTAFVNNAGIVSPGSVKPTSGPTTAKRESRLVVIAHITEPVDKYLLQDFEPLASFISMQMVAGLGRKLEAEVLNGDGTDLEDTAGAGIVGLLNRSGQQLQPFVEDKVTSLRIAATKLEMLGHDVSAYIMHPLDWAAIETARNASGAFDLGTAVDRARRQVWGKQVVLSSGMPQGTALALDTAAVNLNTDTDGVRVEWDRSQGFARNQVHARVEGRFGLDVLFPDALIQVQLSEPELED